MDDRKIKVKVKMKGQGQGQGQNEIIALTVDGDMSHRRGARQLRCSTSHTVECCAVERGSVQTNRVPD
jgi:hypothetical protein